MAPNGTATSRKSELTLPPAIHYLTMSTTAPKPIKSEERTGVPLDSLFDDLKDDDVKHETKKAVPGMKKAGNWDVEDAKGNIYRHTDYKPNTHTYSVAGIKSKDSSARSTPKAGINKVPSPLSNAFPTAKPMSDKPETLKCTHCKRAVSKHVMPKHIEGCLNKKQEKQRKKKEAKDARDAAARKEAKSNGAADSDEEEEVEGKKTGNKNSATNALGGASKKRKADADEDEKSAPAKKKKKGGADNAKSGGGAKPARPKAPVDVERQCGVELPLGGQCARSLTCKSHSMGAKRAVPGRSAPYDKLLMEYQRKNQAKLQKAQFDSQQPREEDEVAAGPVDSEEERDLVVQAVGRAWGGRPIWQPSLVPLRSKYQHNRIKGMLQSALGNRSGASGLFGGGTGGGGGGFFGSVASASAQPNTVDENGLSHVRRGSVVPGARSMIPPASRKASVASAVGA